MLGAGSSLLERSGEAVMAEAAVKAAQHEGGESETTHEGVVGGVRENDNSGGDDHEEGAAAVKGGEEGDKVSSGGNRWPRQETLALLKIRLDMDAAFRDSSLKGPLWEEVARKLAQIGHKRSAKKCKEKFENVYKYHKRTKEGRSGKAEGKTYKFFDELQALENQYNLSHPKPQPSLLTSELITPTKNTESSKLSHVTVTCNPTVISPPSMPVPTNPTIVFSTAPTTTTMNSRIPPAAQNSYNPFPVPNMSVNLFASTSTSSSTASDEGLEERYRKKRKWKDYFRRLTRKMIVKQEEMQKMFLEAVDKRDQERMAREEAWRMQEMGRINREHEILVQERSTAAAKDAAVIAFLQKLSDQQNPILQPCSQSQPRQQAVEVPMIQLQQPREAVGAVAAAAVNVGVSKMENGDTAAPAGSSRWPKTEVHALITLRTSLDSKYQENAPKGPLWEDISKGMKRLGYNRNAKRCKEKWENINKYFKKVKESNKKRPEDSKTCPYFHQLEAIYKDRSKTSSENSIGDSFHDVSKQNSMMEPLMVQPEQQWRPPHHEQAQQLPSSFMEGFRVENNNYQYQNNEREQDNEDDDGDDDENNDVDNDDEDTVEDEGLGSYEITTNKLASFNTVE